MLTKQLNNYIMKRTFKYLAIGAALILATQQATAQLGYNLSEIIEEKGADFEVGKTNDSVNYIYYKDVAESKQGETYELFMVYYFTPNDNGIPICYSCQIIEPDSETKIWLEVLKEHFVEVDTMKFKNSETGSTYEIEVEENLCVLSIYKE